MCVFICFLVVFIIILITYVRVRPDASLQLQCGIPALSRSKPANIAVRNKTFPMTSTFLFFLSSEIFLLFYLQFYLNWPARRCKAGAGAELGLSSPPPALPCDVRADSNAAFMISLGVIRNSSGGLLSSMLLANQCSVVVTTPLAACNVSLAGVTGTLSAPVQVLGDDVLSSDIGVTGFVAGRFSFVDI